MKKIEMILIFGAIIGLLLALFGVPLNSLIVSVFFVALGLLYFYLGFALFNDIQLRRIFNAESYKGLGTWRILIAVGTGLALSMLTIGFMFTILSYPMANTFLISGIILTTIMIFLTAFKNSQEKNQFYKNIIFRCVAFIVIAVIFLLMPEQIFERP